MSSALRVYCSIPVIVIDEQTKSHWFSAHWKEKTYQVPSCGQDSTSARRELLGYYVVAGQHVTSSWKLFIKIISVIIVIVVIIIFPQNYYYYCCYILSIIICLIINSKQLFINLLGLLNASYVYVTCILCLLLQLRSTNQSTKYFTTLHETFYKHLFQLATSRYMEVDT